MITHTHKAVFWLIESLGTEEGNHFNAYLCEVNAPVFQTF